MSAKRVNIPELTALIGEVNSRYVHKNGMPLSAKRCFTMPYPSLRQVVLIEFEPHPDTKTIQFINDPTYPTEGWIYKDTHVFDLPKQAKEFLVKRLNILLEPVEGYPEKTQTGDFNRVFVEAGKQEAKKRPKENV